jgi:hypothetical protein
LICRNREKTFELRKATATAVEVEVESIEVEIEAVLPIFLNLSVLAQIIKHDDTRNQFLLDISFDAWLWWPFAMTCCLLLGKYLSSRAANRTFVS